MWHYGQSYEQRAASVAPCACSGPLDPFEWVPTDRSWLQRGRTCKGYQTVARGRGSGKLACGFLSCMLWPLILMVLLGCNTALGSEVWNNNAAYYVYDISKEIIAEYYPNISTLALDLDVSHLQGSTDTLYFREREEEYIICENDWPLSGGDSIPLKNFTISVWVAVKSRHGKRTIMAKYCKDNTTYNGSTKCDGSLLVLSILSGHPQIEIILKSEGRLNKYVLLSKKELTLKTWQHVAVTYNGEKLMIYVNGKLDVEYLTNGTSLPLLSSTTSIGNRLEDYTNSFFSGLVNALNVWNVALSDEEILYTYTTAGMVSPESLIGHYSYQNSTGFFDEVTNTQCQVSSLSANFIYAYQKEYENSTTCQDPYSSAIEGVGLSTTINVQINPEVPAKVSENESLLKLKTLYSRDGLLPISLVPSNHSLFVTAIASGVWQFEMETHNGRILGLKEGKLVWGGYDCKGEGTSDKPYPAVCLALQNKTDVSAFLMSSVDVRRIAGNRSVSNSLEMVQPFGIAKLTNGTLVISDAVANVIWSYDPYSKQMGVFAGSGKRGRLDGPKASATFDGPTAVVANSKDVVFVSDTYSNSVRKIKDGIVTTLAGSSLPGYADSINGSSVMFNMPFGLSLSTDESILYVADTNNHVIRQVSPLNGSTASVAGSITAGFADGIGPLSTFGAPVDITQVPWAEEELFIADLENSALRRLNKKWAQVDTPVQMIGNTPDYQSTNYEYETWKDCKWSSTLNCIKPITIPPTYGILRHGKMVLLANTAKHAIQVLEDTGETFGSRMAECHEEEKNKEHLKVVIASSVASVFLAILLIAGCFFLNHQYRKKKEKLQEKEKTFKTFMSNALLSDGSAPTDAYMQAIHLKSSSSPLDQALSFLNEFLDGRIPSHEEAEQIRKVLLCGALVNGDVSKPLYLDETLGTLEEMGSGSYLAQVISTGPKRRRPKNKWKKTWKAYHAANLLRTASNQGMEHLRLQPVLHPDSAPMPTLGELEKRESTKNLLSSTDDYRVDLFALDSKTNHHSLSALSMWLFKDHNLFHNLPLNQDAMSKFALKIEENMKDVPYHNRIHVAGVLHGMNSLIVNGGLISYIADEYELMACLVAAIVHDFQHPGVNNQFLVSTEHDLALKYNDEAPLENFHLSSAFALMKTNRDCDFMSAFSHEDKVHVRERMINMVMATDMSKHFEILNQGKLLLSYKDHFTQTHQTFLSKGKSRKEKMAMPFIDSEMMNESERIVILKLAMKCADLYHVYQDFEQHEKWCFLIIEEFCRQGDQEREAGLQVMGLFDRESLTPEEFAKNQTAFLDIVVIPLFELLSQILPATSSLLIQIRSNRDMWYSRINNDYKLGIFHSS